MTTDDQTDDVERRRYLKALAAAGVLGTGGLAGCSGDGSSTDTGNGGNDSGDGGGGDGGGDGGGANTTNIVYHDRREQQRDYANGFNEGHDNIAVEATIESNSARYKQTLANIAAGNAPDVLGLDIVRVAQFADMGALSDLGDWLSGLSYSDDIPDSLKTGFSQYQNTVVGAPFWLDLSAYFYNKKHFEQAGLDPENPPATFSGFRDALRKLSSDGPGDIALAGALHGGPLGFFGLPHFWSTGANVRKWTEDGMKVDLDSPEAIQAAEHLTKLVRDDSIETNDLLSASWDQFHSQFLDGSASVVFSSGFVIGEAESNNPELYQNLGSSLMPAPEGKAQKTFVGGNAITIPTQTQQDDAKFKAAKEFAKWVNTEEGMKITLQHGMFPGRQSGFDLPEAQKKRRGELFKPLKQGLSNGQAPTLDPNNEEALGFYRAELTKAFQGKKSAEAACKTAATKMRDLY